MKWSACPNVSQLSAVKVWQTVFTVWMDGRTMDAMLLFWIFCLFFKQPPNHISEQWISSRILDSLSQSLWMACLDLPNNSYDQDSQKRSTFHSPFEKDTKNFLLYRSGKETTLSANAPYLKQNTKFSLSEKVFLRGDMCWYLVTCGWRTKKVQRQSYWTKTQLELSKKLSKSLVVDHPAVSRCLHGMRRTQKEAIWLPYELTEKTTSHDLIACQAKNE